MRRFSTPDKLLVAWTSRSVPPSLIQKGHGRGRPCHRALGLLGALIVALGSVGPAAAQAQIPITRVPQDERENTQALPPLKHGWHTLDTAINPKRPELGSTNLIAEIVAHELLDFMSTEAYEKAEEAAETLVAVAPRSPLSHYNHACVLSRRSKIDEALAALEQSIDLGWRRASHIAIDPDLDNIRSDPRFAALMEKLNALIESEKITPRPLRDDPWLTRALQLESQVPAISERYQTPGFSITLIDGGEPVWTGEFGTLDRRTGDPVTEHSLFKLYAPARLFAAIVALELEEQGVWDLDDPITRYLPELTLPEGMNPQEITLRRVLSFTGGIVYDELAAWEATSTEEEISGAFTVNADRVGSKYTYSPRTTLLIGRAIEEAIAPRGSADEVGHEEMEGAFAHRVRAGVLLPLRMKRTLARMPSSDRFSIAVGHTEYGTPYRTDIIAPLRPGSPYYTTAGDLAKLVEFMMGALNGFARAPLSAESLDALYQTGLEGPDGFGLGIRIRDTEFGRCAEVVEVNEGAGCLIRWYPDSGDGVVVLFNSATGFEAAERIAHLALGGI